MLAYLFGSSKSMDFDKHVIKCERAEKWCAEQDIESSKMRGARSKKKGKQCEMKRIWSRPTNQTARYFNYSPFLCLTYERSNETEWSQQSNQLWHEVESGEIHFRTKTHRSNGGVVISCNWHKDYTQLLSIFINFACIVRFVRYVFFCFALQSNDVNHQIPFHIRIELRLAGRRNVARFVCIH